MLACELKARGVDAIDASSGGFEGATIQAVADYQVPLANAVRNQSGLPTIAVGLLGNTRRAEDIIASGEADFIALARGALDDPNWPVHARHELGDNDYDLWPNQAQRVRERDRALGQRGWQAS